MRQKNTRERILATSLKQFSKEGFDAASMRKIAKEVGVRESAIYNHFSSKNKILESLLKIEKSINPEADLLTDQLVDKINQPKKFLKLFTDNLFELWGNEERLLVFNLLFNEALSSRSNTYSLFEDINNLTKLWEMIFSEMISFKVIRKSDPIVLANEFISPLFFFRIKYYSTKNSAERKKIKKEIQKHIDFFSNVIQN